MSRRASPALAGFLLTFGLVLAGLPAPVAPAAEEPPLAVPAPPAERVEPADTDNDGKPDEWKIYQGDLLVRMERDRDKNGKVEVWVYYEQYTVPPKEGEEGGQPRTSTRPLRSEVDRDGNGTVDQVRWMKEGRPDRELADLNLDGKPDAWVYYNKQGVKELMIMDKNHDGRPDAWFYYGQGGTKLVGGKVDEDFDGTPERMFGQVPPEETRQPW